MKNKIITVLLVAFSASAAAPVFASGYGPAPFYKPSAGAPASQRGQSALTLGSENGDAQQAHGGVVSGQSQWGGRAEATPRDTLLAHH